MHAASVAADALELEEVGLAKEEVRDDPLQLARASRQVIIGPLHVRLSEGAREGAEDLNLDSQARLPALSSQQERQLAVRPTPRWRGPTTPRTPSAAWALTASPHRSTDSST